MVARISVREFAVMLNDLLRTDRDSNLGGSGYTGEGKSTFLTHVMDEYGKVSGVPWSFQDMTWSRKELLDWIDGPNRKIEFSAINVDELFLLFYKRNWYDEGQIDAIATLNMCRDRHLLIGGNIPNFWDLDGAFTSRIRFFFYVPTRGIAWVFEQDNNPFSQDQWNKTRNRKIFEKDKNPYMISNFVFEIKFPDWSPKQKDEYYRIRNRKRVLAIKENKKTDEESYRRIKVQRDKLIKYIMMNQDQLRPHRSILKEAGVDLITTKDLSTVTGLTTSMIRKAILS